MKLTLTTEGLLDPRQFSAWSAERRRAIHAAVAKGMAAGAREVREAARAQMRSAFQVKRPSFIASMGVKVFDRKRDRLLNRVGVRVLDFLLGLARSGFRAYVHDPRRIEGWITAAGFRKHYESCAFLWRTQVYVRDGGDRYRRRKSKTALRSRDRT